MPRHVEAPIGKRFGRLVVQSELDPVFDPCGKKRRIFLCACDCGSHKLVKMGHLGTMTNSCGCLRREKSGQLMLTHGKARRGVNRSKEYGAWAHMLQRCYNPADKSYPDYGGRGIQVCEEWQNDFVSFHKCVGDAPSKDSMIGRIDNDGNYEPGNVRWEMRVDQNRNKRSNVMIEYRGEVKTLYQWADDLGIPGDTLWQRIRLLNWPIEKAMTQPVRRW